MNMGTSKLVTYFSKSAADQCGIIILLANLFQSLQSDRIAFRFSDESWSAVTCYTLVINLILRVVELC